MSECGDTFDIDLRGITHKRNRTVSQSERIRNAEERTGVIKSFSREQGHGFIIMDGEEQEELFVHVYE